MADNVFALLAQQEMDRPQRELQQMQALQQKMALKKLMDEQQYNDNMKTYLAAQPQSRDITSLSSIPTPIARDANAPAFDTGEGGLLASLNPMSQQTVTEQKPLTIADQFKRQYDYHNANGRPDLAQQVMDHQIELSTKAAKVAAHMYKQGGKEGLAQWLQSNPDYSALLGDPSSMKLTPDGVLFPATGPDGKPVPGEYWHRDENGKPVFKSIKPEAATHIPEGAAIPDGKGGWIVPAPKADKTDRMQIKDIPSADGKTAQTYLVNTADGSKTPISTPYKVSSQVPKVTVTNGTNGNDSQIAAWADKIAKGESALSEIPGRGPIRSQVVEYLAKNYPEVNLAEAGARRKWTQSSNAMQTLALVDATKGVIEDMRKAYKKLDKTDIPVLNAAQDVWQKWSGNPDRAEYMSMKNYGIQEVEKMLSGSGAMSDHRIKLAFDNLKETNTPEQFERAIQGIQNVMAEREKATRQGPYPQGQKQGQGGKALDAPTAQKFLRQAGGNKDKARELAKKAGYNF